MTTADEMVNALTASLDGDEEILVIHSSLPYLRPPADDPRWEFMHALRCITDRGLTVALPAFTFRYCSQRVYHFRNSRSETGIIAEWAADLVGFRRTPHPIYSFVTGGPLAARLCSLRSTTTFSDDSPFGMFEHLNARIFVLGCGWEYCTQFHRYEELHNAPYRYYKNFEGVGDFGDGFGERPIQAQMYVRDLELNPENDWSRLIEHIRQEPGTKRFPLWSGMVESVRCAEIASSASELLAADPWVFVANGRVKAAAQRNARAAAKEPALRCAVLGNSNLANLAKTFREIAAALTPDRCVETYAVPFGQLDREIIASDSGLKNFDARIAYFADRPQDLIGRPQWSVGDAEVLIERVAMYAESIARYRVFARGWIVVHTFADMEPAFDFGQDRQAVIQRLNETLKERLRGLENIYFFDMVSFAACAPSPVGDPRLWHLGRFPFSTAFDKALATRWAGLLLDAFGRSARLIVLDLDNTLWGGILGEDGKAALKVGGDYPGNAFLAFERALKRLSEQGIALAVVSKNDESNALEAMATLPAMVLRPDDFVAHRINWRPKAENIEEICRELSLGMQSVLFVDDNPVERESVRAELPDAHVLELPDDPAEYVRALADCPWINRLALTAEDSRRVAVYKARSGIETARRALTDLESFYASLGMTLHVTPMNEFNRIRIQQLVAKTNQFNATTRRYDARDLTALSASGAKVLSLGLQDRFTARDEIGVLILAGDREMRSVRIDEYLLSCRVLGRGLETAILAWTADYARRRGAQMLMGEIIETERNTPVRSVYSDAGFEPGSPPGVWCLDLNRLRRTIPNWLNVEEHFPPAAHGAWASVAQEELLPL